jgi:selenocysteine lyase/cysteine desulfurase
LDRVFNIFVLHYVLKMSTFDVTAVRARFPALQQEQVFMDNAGGVMLVVQIRHLLTSFRRQPGPRHRGRFVSSSDWLEINH